MTKHDQPPSPEEIANAAKQLAADTQSWQQADSELSTARSNECAAANHLRESQKQFDALMEKLRSAAPAGDWKNEREHRRIRSTPSGD